MFGRNPVRKLDRSDGTRLFTQGMPWRTIQGEGPYAGLPATFIRLWGCHLHCMFCDTDFESDPRAIDIMDLVKACEGVELVVLTGGEPLRQNIVPLCDTLYKFGHEVQVETAGSFALQQIPHGLWPSIVVSPKTPLVDPMICDNAMAWKYIISIRDGQDPDDGLPITNTQEADGRFRHLARPPEWIGPKRVYVQPMDEQDPKINADNMAACVKLSLQYGYRVSLQTHKILGVL
jgi:7-carboxy-7-deazaguanine synthase